MMLFDAVTPMATLRVWTRRPAAGTRWAVDALEPRARALRGVAVIETIGARAAI
jgi:hypothetical protein